MNLSYTRLTAFGPAQTRVCRPPWSERAGLLFFSKVEQDD